jgi:hypothetical protein
VNTYVLNPVKSITDKIPQYHFFYLKVQPTSNPSCSWTSYSYADNCQFLKDAVSAIKSLGWNPVIFTTVHIWRVFFGYDCDTFAQDTGALVGYAKYDHTGHVNPE